MKHAIYIVLVLLLAALWSCEAADESLDGCEEEEASICSRIVSCCESILGDDPTSQSEAAIFCGLDQIQAQGFIDDGDPDNETCWDMYDKDPYQELCFSCDIPAFDESSR